MVIWENRVNPERLGYIIYECPECKVKGTFSVEQIRKKLHLYFIPTFNYSTEQYVTCTNCKATLKVPKELKSEMSKNLISQEELSSVLRKANNTKPIKTNITQENNPNNNQKVVTKKDSAPAFVCLCCGAPYNSQWWETYGARYRCCSGLPNVEQEELWDNRLYPEIPLNNCPHQL